MEDETEIVDIELDLDPELDIDMWEFDSNNLELPIDSSTVFEHMVLLDVFRQ